MGGRRRRAALAFGFAVAGGLAAAFVHAQPLTAAELEALERLGREAAPASARAAFAGQAARIAEHYLRNTGTPPASSSYFAVLGAAGDGAAALVLIRGLLDPPAPDSGPEFESGGRRQRLPRYEGEIEVALRAVLANEAVSRDPGVARALADAVEAGRAKPGGLGYAAALRATALLGELKSEEARTVLRRLGKDADAQIRSNALSALGAAGGGGDVALLAQALGNDPLPRVRTEAAQALGRLKSREALPALNRALLEEPDAQVVDAVIFALGAMQALPRSPVECVAAAARARDFAAAALAGACWRARAGREELVQAALAGAPMVRVLALDALFASPRAEPRLVRPPLARPAPPPPAAGPGPRPTTAAPLLAPQTRPSTPAFDEAMRRRLLQSATETLVSISGSAAHQLNSLFYEIAGADMRLALQYADRIETPRARSPNTGSMAAAAALRLRAPEDYRAARAPRQVALGAAFAACALLLLAFRRTRPAAAAAAAPFVAWAAWSLFATSARELPPLVLAPLTVGGSASLAAAAAAFAATLSRGGEQGWIGAALKGGAALGAAAAAAFFICGAARWYDVFPVLGEGWELIFEPIAAALVAPLLAAAGLAAAAAQRRLIG